MTTAALVLMAVLGGAPPERSSGWGWLGRDARVGEWVAYHLEGLSGRGGYFRLAVVGRELEGRGRAALWVELEWASAPSFTAPLAQLKVLVDPGGGLRRAYGGVAGGPLRALPPAALRRWEVSGRMPVAQAIGQPDARLRRGGRAMLKTPAGKISAASLELVEAGRVVRRLWVSPQVPLLQLVRLEIPGVGPRMALQAYGTGATPRIPLPPLGAADG